MSTHIVVRLLLPELFDPLALLLEVLLDAARVLLPHLNYARCRKGGQTQARREARREKTARTCSVFSAFFAFVTATSWLCTALSRARAVLCSFCTALSSVWWALSTLYGGRLRHSNTE